MQINLKKLLKLLWNYIFLCIFSIEDRLCNSYIFKYDCGNNCKSNDKNRNEMILHKFQLNVNIMRHVKTTEID